MQPGKYTYRLLIDGRPTNIDISALRPECQEAMRGVAWLTQGPGVVEVERTSKTPPEPKYTSWPLDCWGK